jgi:hypothetical protein
VLPSPSSSGANESSRPGFDLGKDLKLIDQVFDAGTTDKIDVRPVKWGERVPRAELIRGRGERGVLLIVNGG